MENNRMTVVNLHNQPALWGGRLSYAPVCYPACSAVVCEGNKGKGLCSYFTVGRLYFLFDTVLDEDGGVYRKSKVVVNGFRMLIVAKNEKTAVTSRTTLSLLRTHLRATQYNLLRFAWDRGGCGLIAAAKTTSQQQPKSQHKKQSSPNLPK